jgi:hypothetical protein
MSSEETRTSDRFQIITAVLFMSFFAAVLLILAMPKNQIAGWLCNYTGDTGIFARLCSSVPSRAVQEPKELVSSRITAACLDREGLKISVTFDEPLTGSSHIEVFTTGDDYFPSEQGISDSFRINLTIADEADHLNILVPVDSMPVGEQIFGNVATNGDVSSFVAYSIKVADCASANAPLPRLVEGDIPTIHSATCLPSSHLMIAFQFEGQVLGQYRVLVDDTPYQLASVINQPATLFFSGVPPSEGSSLIRLISATDEVVIFEETYTPPVCAGTS